MFHIVFHALLLFLSTVGFLCLSGVTLVVVSICVEDHRYKNIQQRSH